MTALGRTLPVHGSVAHDAGSERPAAEPPLQGNQGPPVPAVLLPHVWVGVGDSEGPRQQERRGRAAVATEWRAEHGLAEGPGGVPEQRSAPGENPFSFLVLFQTMGESIQKKNFLFPPQIVFEAVRGPSVRSDVAIDDITLESGPCPGDPPLYNTTF